MNQLIIWNLANKGKESSIYHAFPITNVPLGYQIDEDKFFFIKVLQLLKKEW